MRYARITGFCSEVSRDGERDDFRDYPQQDNSYMVGRVNGHPCIVKSNEMKRYEREFLRQCAIYKGRGISTPFRLVVDVYYPDHTHDLDGCFKALLDLLQACGVRD